MDIKLILIDLDGTLLNDNQTYDYLRFRNVVKKLNKKGVKIAVATGNSHYQTLHYLDEKTLPYIYLATYNGSDIRNKDEIIRKNSIPRDVFERVAKEVNNIEGFHTILNTDKNVYIINKENSPYDLLDEVFINLYKIDNIDQIPKDEDGMLISITTDTRQDEVYQISLELNERFKEIEVVKSTDFWIDMFPHNSGKHVALEYMQKKYNIDYKETLTIGDSNNDISMMKRAKYSVAMKKASKELLEVVDYQIGSNNDSAVISLLEEIDQNSDMLFIEKYRI